jgi:hypothetical protein
MDGRWALIALGCIAAAPLAAACLVTPQQPDATYPPPSFTAAPPVTAPAAASSSSATAQSTSTTPPPTPSLTTSASLGPPSLGQVFLDPVALAQFLASLGTPVNPNLTQPAPVPDALEAGLRGQQLRLAPGMTAEGPLLKQTLQQGQHTAIQIPMQQGKCYVVLGFSQPGGVKDLDLYLLAPPFFNILAAQDATNHNAPYLGADAAVPPRPMCPSWPIPLQYKLEVFAKDGSGGVAVQVYSKPSQ